VFVKVAWGENFQYKVIVEKNVKSSNDQSDCQLNNLQTIIDGPQEDVPFRKSIRLTIRRLLGPRRVKKIKLFANNFLNWKARIRGKYEKPSIPVVHTSEMNLNTGDYVRVRSYDEIKTTLNNWRQLKGCSFAPEMEQYCGTTHRVLKPVHRFVDERDFRVYKTKGIVLLDGVICKGTSSLGSCDRNCFYFWREEWLEKIDDPTA
jgi:hypothetical protein